MSFFRFGFVTIQYSTGKTSSESLLGIYLNPQPTAQNPLRHAGTMRTASKNAILVLSKLSIGGLAKCRHLHASGQCALTGWKTTKMAKG